MNVFIYESIFRADLTRDVTEGAAVFDEIAVEVILRLRKQCLIINCAYPLWPYFIIKGSREKSYGFW